MKNTIYLARALLVSVITASPLVIAAGPASAASVYYVAPNGNDSAAGTQAAPWASIARAQTAAKPGDTVYFRGGRYAYTRANSACSSQTARVDAITLNKSGSSGNPIRYWAHPGGEAGLRLLAHEGRLPHQGIQHHRNLDPSQRTGSHRRTAEQQP